MAKSKTILLKERKELERTFNEISSLGKIQDEIIELKQRLDDAGL